MTARALATIGFVLFAKTIVPTALPQDSRTIHLPAPHLNAGRPLMQVLQDRRSTREFGPEKLSEETLSNLFWAAFGINRPENDGRTAPSALDMQEIDLYAALPEGLYKYEPRMHQLVQVHKEDIRAVTGTDPYVKDAPLNIVYVADYSRMGKAPGDERDFYSAADAGFISQNVYLYCASEGLATVVRASLDKPVLAKAMKLRSDQKIVLAQSVGRARN